MPIKRFPKPLCKKAEGKDQTTQRAEEQGFYLHASLNKVKDLSTREHRSFLVARELVLEILHLTLCIHVHPRIPDLGRLH